MSEYALGLIFRGDDAGILALKAQLSENNFAFTESNPRGSVGGGDLLTVVVPISLVMVPAATKIIMTMIKSKTLTVEAKGMKLSGNADDVKEALQYLIQKTPAKNANDGT